MRKRKSLGQLQTGNIWAGLQNHSVTPLCEGDEDRNKDVLLED